MITASQNHSIVGAGVHMHTPVPDQMAGMSEGASQHISIFTILHDAPNSTFTQINRQNAWYIFLHL